MGCCTSRRHTRKTAEILEKNQDEDSTSGIETKNDEWMNTGTILMNSLLSVKLIVRNRK